MLLKQDTYIMHSWYINTWWRESSSVISEGKVFQMAVIRAKSDFFSFSFLILINIVRKVSVDWRRGTPLLCQSAAGLHKYSHLHQKTHNLDSAITPKSMFLNCGGKLEFYTSCCFNSDKNNNQISTLH